MSMWPDSSPRMRAARLLPLLTAFALAGVVAWYASPRSAIAAPCAGDPESVAICETLNSSSALGIGLDQRLLAQLNGLYARRHYLPLWSGAREAEAQTSSVLAMLKHADEDGLEPSDYRVEDSAGRGPWATAKLDLRITDAVLRYARDLRVGRVPADSSDSDIELPPQPFNVRPEFEAALLNGTVAQFLAGQRPPHQAYDDLRDALATYRALAAEGSWRPLAVPRKDWRSHSDAVERLRARFALEDVFLRSDFGDDPELEQAALNDAVRIFQVRNGLVVDGKLGRKTIAALNISPAQRIAQIISNMERWRWMPRTFEDRYILVNVPQNELEVIDHGAVILRSRAIVGRPADPSPVLRTTVRGLRINPPWNVPGIIARREILPKLRKDPTYLRDQNMILRNGPVDDPHGLHINWRAMKTIPYDVQQLAGPKSALGVIKLDMPNRFDVYLHDTPGKAAFQADERFLSHGCIRVEQILPLASIVSAGDPDSGAASLQSMISTGATIRLPAGAILPVYLAYWTAFVGEDGGLNFRPDVYGRDKRLIVQLKGVRNTRVTLVSTACCVG